jgi:nickel/cobalt exporter
VWLQLVEIQREIYGQVADVIRQFSNGAGWVALFGILPMGIVFGAVHALTPGHSKSVLAAYVAGSPISAMRAFLTALTLSATHVIVAVLIAVFSLPLVSLALGNVGRAPEMEAISRALLALVGAWMLWRALWGHRHNKYEGEAFGFFAGLIPCPLTLFVMTFAIARGVPEAGLVFSLAMMAGVAATLSAIALLAAVVRLQTARQLQAYPRTILGLSRGLEALAGLILVAIAVREFAS